MMVKRLPLVCSDFSSTPFFSSLLTLSDKMQSGKLSSALIFAITPSIRFKAHNFSIFHLSIFDDECNVVFFFSNTIKSRFAVAWLRNAFVESMNHDCCQKNSSINDSSPWLVVIDNSWGRGDEHTRPSPPLTFVENKPGLISPSHDDKLTMKLDIDLRSESIEFNAFLFSSRFRRLVKKGKTRQPFQKTLLFSMECSVSTEMCPKARFGLLFVVGQLAEAKVLIFSFIKSFFFSVLGTGQGSMLLKKAHQVHWGLLMARQAIRRAQVKWWEISD